MHKNIMIICGVIYLVTFGLFLFTLCPTIYWEDSAAFSAVQSVLGIPHSPGFPIYVILGKIFTLIPVESFAFRSNLMSAFWGSLSLVVLYLLILQMSRRESKYMLGQRLHPNTLGQGLHPCPPSKTKPNDLNSQLPVIAGVLFFAFSSSFWLQTIRAEVYTLNIFFTLLLIFLLSSWSQLESSLVRFRILILFSFIWGLSLANHPLLLVTLMPAFLLFFVLSDFKSFLNSRSLLIGCAFFILGFSFYLYLPIRSNLFPPINWGKPDTWSGLLSYLLRMSQSSVTPSDSSIPYLNRLWFNLSFPVQQFGLAFFWWGVVGALDLFKSKRRIFLLTFSIFILNVLTATWATDFSLRNYDLLGYLLPSLSMFAIWFTFGVFYMFDLVSKNVVEKLVKRSEIQSNESIVSQHSRDHQSLPHILRFLLYGLILLLPLFQITRNFDQCNKRSSIWAYRYAEQILNSVKKDALILVGDDNTLTSLWYLNLAGGIRPDVKILSISALMQKSYREQINQQYREIKLPPMELKDAGEMAYQVSLLNADKFPIYSTHFTNYPPFVQRLRPSGYVFEFDPKRVILTDKDMEEQKRFLRIRLENQDLDDITREHFGNLVFNLGVFYDQSGIGANSLECFLWALEIDPSNPRIYFQLGKAFLKNGDREKALDFFQAGLEIDPYNLEIKNLLEKT